MKKLLNSSARSHYIIAFFATLCVSIGLMIFGAITPPKGEIDGSLITAVGVIFLWPALAFANKAIEEGRTAVIRKGEFEVSINKKHEDENRFEDVN